MSTMTYREQLRHPLWQKKRLEVLERAEWRCQCCYAEDQTLHVHHKRYIKGRMAWQYDPAELAALCETCHQQMHRDENAISALLATLEVDGGPESISEAGGVLAGLYGSNDPTYEAACHFIDSVWGWNIGFLGRAVHSIAKLRIHEIAQLSGAMSDPQFVMELRTALAASVARTEEEIRRSLERVE